MVQVPAHFITSVTDSQNLYHCSIKYWKTDWWLFVNFMVNNSGYTGTSGQNFLFSLTNNYKISHCTGQHGCSHPQYNTIVMDRRLVGDTTSLYIVT